MSDRKSREMEGTTGSDRRGRERRKSDRRGDQRRVPPPPWRRPAAFVAYGVVGALVVVLAFRGLTARADDPAAAAAIVDQTAMSEEYTLPPVAPGTGREAYTVAEYEALIAEGERAVGLLVQTELFCGSISPIAIRAIQGTNRTLVALADAEGRVAGAECRWSRQGRSADFILVVPPPLAEEFAGAPEEELNFVRLRRVPAQVEWLGRSEALALRYAGVLRDITY